jgi:DNA-binding transcriptional LysR family regulator
METNRIAQFRVVVETGNLRKAADLLGISHSGLSKSMKALEAELGFSLFHASGRGIAISDQGQLLYQRSARFLQEYELLRGSVEQRETMMLRLGSFEVFTSFFIGPLLKTYLPEIQVEIHELVPGRLEEALLFNKVDLGITYEPVPRKGIDYIKVARVQMAAYALTERFQNVAFSEIPFVIPVNPLEGAPSVVKGRDAWPSEKIERKIQYRVDLMASGLEIARRGLAAIYIPRFVARLHNAQSVASQRLEVIKVPRAVAQVSRDVYIVKRDSTPESKVIRQIAKALRAVCSEPTGTSSEELK